MAKDFSKRTKSTQRNSGVTAGFQNDFIHVGGPQANYQVTPAGGYSLVNVVINTAPGSGAITLKCGNDIIASIGGSTVSAREFKYNCYLYDKLFYSADVDCDVTFIVSKG